MTVGNARPPGGLVPALRAALRGRLRHPTTTWQPLARFLPHLAQAAQGQWETILAQALERMKAEAADEVALLKARFWQGHTVRVLSYRYHLAPSTLYARQRRAVEHLAQHLWALEQAARRQAQMALAHKCRHLPSATYTQLFGLDAALERLRAWLLDPAGPRWVLIEGLGGLGKTTLAHAFAHGHLEHWDDLAWVDAHAHRRTWESETQPLDTDALVERLAWQLAGAELASRPPRHRAAGLRQMLAARRALVVLDDLLPGTIGPMLAVLPPPPAQSRFLITSRYRYPSPGAHLPMRELSRADSLALLRAEIHQRGLPELPTDALAALYERVGGNPLALKLTVGHLAFLPLERVLEGLTHLPSGPGEDLFAYIYEPLVAHLPPDARRVLEAMPYFAPQGATYDELQHFVALPPRRLDEALYQLMYHALLDLDPRPPARYFIHRLTYVYLTHQHRVEARSPGGGGTG